MFDLRSPVSKVIFYGTLVAVSLFVFFPLFWMVSTSFKPNAELFESRVVLLPQNPTVDNYVDAFTRRNLGTYLKNSIFVSTTASAIATLVAAYAAYSFSKFRYLGRNALMYLLLSGKMFPSAVLLITLYMVMSRLRMVDNYPALILAYITFAMPVGTWLLKSYFDRLPDEIIEAARVDGASEMRILHTIMFPLAIPGIVSTALYSFIWAWNDLLYAMTLTSSRGMRTLAPGLVMSYLGEFQNNWGGMMAASIIASVPVVVAFALLQRLFISGMTAGAVK